MNMQKNLEELLNRFKRGETDLSSTGQAVKNLFFY